MDINDLLDLSNDCISGDRPPCSCACPFGVDVLGFIEKLRSGFIAAAYKLYMRDVALPGIICHICDEPCKNMCVRNEVDESISLRELEKYCWQESGNKPAENFYIPAKNKRVLIVGGGVTGLSCGVKLAQRGYHVELRERGNQLGGRLWDIGEDILPKEALREEIIRIMRLKYLSISLNTKVEALDDQSFDAALVATGASGDNFGAASHMGELYLRDGVFFGGALLNPGQSPLLSCKQGIELSYVIENYLKVGRMDIVRDSNETPCLFKPNIRNIEPLEKATPQNPDAWTKEEAHSEASRCLLCSCGNCMEVCEMLAYYRENVKKFLKEARDTVNKTKINKKTALRKITSCTQCGLCVSSCPVEIDLKKICLESRRILHKRGQLPDALYDYWLDDMAHSNHDAALFVPPPVRKDLSAYLFFPGCQISASDPAYVTESYKWLVKAFPQQMGLLLYCCGAPAYWAGNEEAHGKVLDGIRAKWLECGKPAFIVACPTCHEMFRSHLPEIEIVSLWQLLADKYPAADTAKGTTVSVFDPCTSKYDRKVQQSIRTLLKKAGYETAELPSAGEKARCCGFGGLVYSSNPELVSRIGARNAALGELEFVTYCTNCRDSFAIQNKPSRHILDVLFFEGQDRSRRDPTDLT
ncbi:MAG TPA: heterodisulfide reductase-related iron-sulfur binding cluster, partial [Anaerovoracaceae bacterium]|nr:heterodisulfide reductase-related iron-sulfur binding cluster [Anaerovoracaceae bacterium]